MSTDSIRGPLTPERTFPVAEVFGPTIMGEGFLIGMPCAFVRFGGCDYRCSWCDSMHAVLPDLVRQLPTLTTTQIIARLDALPSKTKLVVLSGGNPALHDLTDLCARLKARENAIAVETQGTRWRPWLAGVDLLTVSPKPPSSGMATDLRQLDAFMGQARKASRLVDLKIVIFDEGDLDFARTVFTRYPVTPELLHTLSLGTNVGEDTRDDLLNRLKWLIEVTGRDHSFSTARVLPQLHVLVWGHIRGV